ncbi:MAG: hypothetical protein QOD01_1879, partial [Actinomycetota bacterium]|nr:hypothetical protein [Actinomycetota bacterium]
MDPFGLSPKVRGVTRPRPADDDEEHVQGEE